VLASEGFFADVGKAGQQVDEARLLGERVFYQAKREPTLLRWEAEALKDDVLATPDVGTYMTDIHRLTAQAEQLPKDVAAERQAILAAFDQRMKGADATLANVKAVVSDANALVTSMDDTSASLNEMLKTAGGVFARFDTWNRWSSTQPSRTFDVREYTQGVQELSVAVGKMNDLLGSSQWGRRSRRSTSQPMAG
jgi:ABC-type transporter Mla subunit MlaD